MNNIVNIVLRIDIPRCTSDGIVDIHLYGVLSDDTVYVFWKGKLFKRTFSDLKYEEGCYYTPTIICYDEGMDVMARNDFEEIKLPVDSAILEKAILCNN